MALNGILPQEMRFCDAIGTRQKIKYKEQCFLIL